MPSRRAATILTIGSLLLPQHAQAQCPDGTPPPCARATPAPAPASIAVLTFRSQSRDTSDVFLAEGLSDDIADRLSRGERVVVISREATRRLRDADALSMAELGRRLNAAYVVSGHLRRSGGQLHILIEVTRARTSQVAWSGPFDRSGDDLASMQVEAAAAIAGAVLGRPVSAPRAAAEPGANGPAFAHLMRGTAFSSRRLQGAAIAELRAAVRLDPRSAVAWARLSQAYSSCRSNGCTASSPPSPCSPMW